MEQKMLPHTHDKFLTKFLFHLNLLLQLRAEYSSFLKQGRSVERLLVNLFHLMPDPPVDVKDTAATAKSPSAKLSYSAHFFTDEPALDLTCKPPMVE